jgi:hypothetical protein
MKDMTALERLIADVAAEAVGPPRPVDAMAMVRTASAQSPKWRFQSMFSATKFVVAGAIVALFGGFLLSGVLTQQGDEPLPPAAASASASPEAVPSVRPTTAPVQSVRSDLLLGVDLVTEEVEPGVYRVLGDGTRDLSWPATILDDPLGNGVARDFGLLAGPEGSVWVFRSEGLYRIGDERTYEWPSDEPYQRFGDYEVTPDGAVHLVNLNEPAGEPKTVATFDGESWNVLRLAGPRVGSSSFDDDGSLWGMWSDNGGSVVGRLDGKQWIRHPVPTLAKQRYEHQGGSGPYIDGVGGLWVLDGWKGLSDRPDRDTLHRFDGSDWERYEVPAGSFRRIEVAPDGTVWLGVTRQEETGPDRGDASEVLARFDGSTWSEHDVSVVVPAEGRHFGGGLGGYGLLAVAPDGEAWAQVIDDRFSGTPCHGVANFDGSIRTTYLNNHCVYALDVASDGSVWVNAAEWKEGGTFEDFVVPDGGMNIHTYVITPEAAAATE